MSAASASGVGVAFSANRDRDDGGHMQVGKFFATLLLTFAFSSVMACGSDPTPEDLESERQPTLGGGSSSSGNAASSSSSSSSSGGPVVDACAQLTGQACGECCVAKHPPTAWRAGEDALEACLCGAMGKCTTDCGATWCARPDVDPAGACLACLETNYETCFGLAEVACANDATCKPALECINACAANGGGASH